MGSRLARPQIELPPLSRPPDGTAERRGQALERELAILAAEIGTGRDLALARALAFYRKFVRRGRREGFAPEAFLKELLDAYAHRDILSEISLLREKVTAIAQGAAKAAKAAPPPKEMTALEIYRAARARKAERAAS